MSYETLADENDRASDVELAETASRVAAQRAKSTKPPPADWDKLTCYDCGNELPIERITAKRFLCVPCKEIEEAKEKGRSV